MVAEEVVITLSGGAPWGFRLQGGVEQQKPLQVAKVRQTPGDTKCPVCQKETLEFTRQSLHYRACSRHLLVLLVLS